MENTKREELGQELLVLLRQWEKLQETQAFTKESWHNLKNRIEEIGHLLSNDEAVR